MEFNRGIRALTTACRGTFNNKVQSRSISAYHAHRQVTKRVTLLPGDGIGSEIADSVVGVFQAAEVPIEFERFDYKGGELGDNSPKYREVLSSLARNGLGLKGSFFTPLGAGFVSRNVQLRKDLDLFANVVPIKNYRGINTRHSNTKVDLVIVRENMQGEYSGHEQEVDPGVVQSLKIVSEYSSRRIVEYAFQIAQSEGRKRVTCVHKANIQKATDGLFLRTFRSVAEKYPSIEAKDMIIDNCCMQLVMHPSQFDVMVTSNLYGNIIANVAGGLVGGPGIIPGANIGAGIAIFEPGLRHSAQDIAGQDKANPTAMLLSGAEMLKYLDLNDHATRIEKAVQDVVADGKHLTRDVGGSGSTRRFTEAVIEKLTN
ncbi:isocitrate dehydrogenase (NAD+) [Planoprotostelium fungivorum]|uniref:Isocitrate dehydrogenase (NAD+) n=1 Tax=Planoprotostelium fungivorum TaxID=1890364 RepID=A0A2P6NW19_9EUKA|nr:isocitrate dehydrogenase (NAD+) [Planoprotostelium fungivorum]